MPQLTLEDTNLRYGAIAVGALRKAFEGSDPSTMLCCNSRHYSNAVIYYCKALSLQSKARPTREGLRTALLSSLLFICFESLRGNLAAALKHVTHGFSMLNELAAGTENAAHMTSLAAAPPALVQELFDCYKPLEMQSRSFMGSYQRSFFLPTPNPMNSLPAAAEQSDVPTPHANVPSGQIQGCREILITQSQPIRSAWPGSKSQGDSCSPLGSLKKSSSASNGRIELPGMPTFTKHSPYFRPKLPTICGLNGLPLVFRTISESQDYWILVQKNMVQCIPMLTHVTSQLALTKTNDETELQQKYASVLQDPAISAFVLQSRYWLKRWNTAYQPLFKEIHRNAAHDAETHLRALNMRVEFLVLWIYTAMPRFSGLHAAKELTPHFRDINRHVETLLMARPSCGFAMDSGWTWPLFMSAFGCRDGSVRADAIRILGQFPVRNALRDSRVFRAIALKNEDAETKMGAEGSEEEVWRRLRRRELLFEDHGSCVIYRSPQKREKTGQWELTEEVAAFSIDSAGRLSWQEVALSDSTSILYGVC